MRQYILPFAILSIFVVAAGPASAEERSNPHSWLGVRLGPMQAAEATTPDAAGQPGGIRITGVFQDSPAAEVGLRAQDVISGVEGQAVGSNMELIRRVREFEGGDWVTLNVMRGDDELDMRVRLSERPADGAIPKLRRGWIGAWTIQLTAQLQEHFGAPEKTGVMVGVIRDGSPAYEAGFELGDVIFEIDGKPVGSESGFKRRVAEAGVGNRSEFALMRDGVELVIESAIEAEPPRRRDR